MLAKFPTAPDVKKSKEKAKLLIKKNKEQIQFLQKKLNAQGKYSLLVIIQGLDASGKDGAARSVFECVNPAGISVHSFKRPTSEELSHDFLWRVHKHVPAKGMIQIFNRSHYEDILVPSVEGYYSDKTIKKRFGIINHFEKMIEHNDTKILKFYLHNSSKNQLKRLTERINLPQKHWKHNDGDWEVREKRNQYHKVYEQIFKKCNTPKWHIIPSDKNWYKTLLISEIVLKELKGLYLKWPALDSEKFKK